MLAIVVIEGLAIALLGLLVTGLLRSHAEILRQLEDLGAGRDERPEQWHAPSTAAETAMTTAQDITGELLDGSAAAIAVTGTTHDTLLAFLSANCATCEPFWEAFADRRLDMPNGARLVIVVQDHEDPAALVHRVSPERTVLMSDEAWTSYDVPGSPHFVYIDGPSGRVTGEGTGASWRQVQSLVQQADSNRRRNQQVVQITERDTPESNPERVDRELLAAGIGPGHPSLYEPLD